MTTDPPTFRPIRYMCDLVKDLVEANIEIEDGTGTDPSGDPFEIYKSVGFEYQTFASRIRSENLAQSIEALDRLIAAHNLVMGVLGALLSRNGGRAGTTDKAISRLFQLTASFIQGISTCELTILQGLYIQGGNLVRQEMETIAAMGEAVKGSSRPMAPNVGELGWNMKRTYGELSELAHLSDAPSFRSSVIKTVESARGVTTIPVFKAETVLRFYMFHMALTIQLVGSLDYLYSVNYGSGLREIEVALLHSVIDLLVEEKFLCHRNRGKVNLRSRKTCNQEQT